MYDKRSSASQESELFVASADGSGGETPVPNGAPGRWPDWERVAAAPAPDPTCSITDMRVRVTEGSPGQRPQASFRVDCHNPTEDTYSVDYATADGTARQPGGYAPESGSLLLPPGESHQQIHVDVIGDSVREPHETFKLTLSGAPVVTRSTAAATIVDDDGFGAAVETADPVVEGDSGSTELELTVRLNHAADQAVTVALRRGSVASGPVSAPSPDDSDLPWWTSLTFDPGEVEKALTFRIFGDTELEGDETLEIMPVSRLIKDANSVYGGVTIVDDDDPVLSIEDATVIEGDSDLTIARFTVTRSHVGGTVEFDFATEDGSATAGNDYVARSGHVSFADGSPTATVEVPVRGDLFDEPDEAFRVRLSNPSHATIPDEIGVGTIEDDDPEPSLSIDDVSVSEGDTGTATAQFTVRLSAPSEKSVTIDYATADGTANAPGDYSAETTQLTIARGSPTATIPIPIAGDRLDEPDETFSVQLSNASNATIANGHAVGTIEDDDPEPSLSIDDVSVSEGHTGATTASFTVSLSARSAKAVSVNYATADGTADAPDDYTATATTELIFDPDTTTRTVRVTVNGDTVFEGDETFSVGLSGAHNATIGDGQGVGTILDDEEPANDDFADAAPLAAGTTTFDTSFATVEADEPGVETDEPAGHPSVWYRLSPGRGGVLLQIEPDLELAQAKRLSVYTGTSVGDLTLVARHESIGAPFDLGYVLLSFATAADQEYYVQVIGSSVLPHDGQSGFPPGIGRGTLDMDFYPSPANDDFADAAPLTTGTTSFDTSFATVQGDEPGIETNEPGGFPSVWYRFTPGRGVVHLHAESAPGMRDTPQAKRLSIYTGTSVGGLVLVARHETFQFPSRPFPPGIVEFEFPTAPGQEYFVQVISPSALPHALQPGVGPGAGEGTMSMTFHPAPANDHFADAAPLAPGTTPFDTSFATVEADEPGLEATEPARFPSVWYRVSPDAGGVVLHAESAPGLARPKRISVYTGTGLGALTLHARSEASGAPFDLGVVDLEFPTADGRQYYVQIVGSSALPDVGRHGFVPGIGQGTLSMAFHPAPATDDFGDAAPLSAGTTAFDTSFASVEAASRASPLPRRRASPPCGTGSARASAPPL